jgi:hypothetical protein
LQVPKNAVPAPRFSNQPHPRLPPAPLGPAPRGVCGLAHHPCALAVLRPFLLTTTFTRNLSVPRSLDPLLHQATKRAFLVLVFLAPYIPYSTGFISLILAPLPHLPASQPVPNVYVCLLLRCSLLFLHGFLPHCSDLEFPSPRYFATLRCSGPGGPVSGPLLSTIPLGAGMVAKSVATAGLLIHTA